MIVVVKTSGVEKEEESIEKGGRQTLSHANLKRNVIWKQMRKARVEDFLGSTLQMSRLSSLQTTK